MPFYSLKITEYLIQQNLSFSGTFWVVLDSCPLYFLSLPGFLHSCQVNLLLLLQRAPGAHLSLIEREGNFLVLPGIWVG